VKRQDILARARRAAALRKLPAGVLRGLVGSAELRELRRGEVLFEEGTPGEHVYLVLRGSLRVRKDMGEGASALVALRGELEWIGELALEPGEQRSASADAEGPTLLLEIPRVAFTRVLREHPEAAFDLLRFVGSRLRESDRALIDSLRKRTDELLARNERLGDEVRRLRGPDLEAQGLDAFVGTSARARRVRAAAARAARNERPLLLVGEPGTGKQLLAGLIHRTSERSAGPFVLFDCSVFEGATVEAELFGCARGGMPGARRARAGALADAAGGTLYLARLDALSPAAQHGIFRFLEVGEFQRVGETRVREADVRVVAGRELGLGSSRGSPPPAAGLRADLVARLDAQRIDVPPLRSRSEDLALVVSRIAGDMADRLGVAPLRFDPTALRVLQTRELPGNGDDVAAEIERLQATCPPGINLGPADLGSGAPDSPAAHAAIPEHYADAVRTFKIQLIQRALREARGNRARAAQRLGIHRSNLSRMIRDLGLEPRQ
jgi:DNA-binding NtrC family response regulator